MPSNDFRGGHSQTSNSLKYSTSPYLTLGSATSNSKSHEAEIVKHHIHIIIIFWDLVYDSSKMTRNNETVEYYWNILDKLFLQT